MLAYVFWHWPVPGASLADYRQRQTAFHEALAAHAPSGFRSSFTSRVVGASWLPAGIQAFEDWYLVEDFTALGALNAGAVAGPRSAAHDGAARLAAGGMAGLYALQAGEVVRRPAHAAWFSKPEGFSYAALSRLLAPVVGTAAGAVWQRQMVLGPAPEYCLQSMEAAGLPPELAAEKHLLEPIQV